MAQIRSLFVDGIDRVLELIENISSDMFNSELMEEIGNYVVFSILNRTGEGKDVNGNPFAPYSPRYKMFRLKHGHPVDKVNLFFSGSMLSSLTYSVFDDRLEIFFMPTYGRTPSGKISKASDAEKAYYLNKQREFFGVSDEDRRKVQRMIQDHLTHVVEDL